MNEDKAGEEPVGLKLPVLGLFNEKAQRVPKKEPKITIELPQPQEPEDDGADWAES